MKVLPIAIVFLLILSSSGLLTVTDINKNVISFLSDTNQGGYHDKSVNELTLRFSDYYFLDQGDYNMVTFKEATSFTTAIGKPMLPSATYVFTFPFGTIVEDIKITFSETTTHTIAKKIIPSPSPLPQSQTATSGFFKLNSTVYASSKIYPPQQFTVQKGAGLENQEHVTLLTVECYPLRYIPANNTLKMSHVINIKISYCEPQNSLVDADEYDLVIIAPNAYSAALQPLIAHKNEYGVETYLETTEDIYSTYAGRDEPEQIKQFIKNAIESYGINYVLLVGDIEKIPIRMSAISWYDFNELPTDLYYADVFNADTSFASWDSNGNNIFGEFTWNMNDGEVEYIDSIDLFPDVGLGRLPCENSNSVDTVVEKIISYETGSYGKDWFNRLILLGGDTFPGWGVNEGEVVTDYISQIMTEFNSIKLWTSENTFKPRFINRELSNGAGFMSYSGHGYEYGFGTSPPDSERRIQYYTPYLLGVKNNNMLPIVFFDACLTATLDLYIGGFNIPGFAWSIVKKSDGGAIASIGSTRVAYASVFNNNIQSGAPRLNVNFFENYHAGATLSELYNNAQNDYLNYCWKDCLTLEEFNLIGDPSLKIGGYP